MPELFGELQRLRDEPPPEGDSAYPLVLVAGERRAFTANTINRDPGWRRRDAHGALRVNPDDVAQLGLEDGGRARLVTKRGSVEVRVESSDRVPKGQIALPNGYGLDYTGENGWRRRTGVSPNELTAAEDRDPIVGTPWHKIVPARLEAIDRA